MAWPWILVAWTLVFAAVACSALESFEVLVICLAGVVFFVVPSSLLVALDGVFSRKRHVVEIGCLAAVIAVSASVLGCWVGMDVSRAQARRSCERGDALAAALENYRSTHGQYPARLEELAPAFVPAIPATCIGIWGKVPFDYEPFNHDYDLSFCGPGWSKWTRGSSGTWICD